ncbi:MAG: MYG1 family protein [Solirubrobacterales bacterium]
MLIATHNGSFHADEVFAIAAMKLLPEPVEVVRTRDREVLAEADMRIDVGFRHDPAGGDFDHHQREFEMTRENGIGYASFGLIWREHGARICGDVEVADAIEQMLVQAVDANDIGQQISQSLIEGVRPMNVNAVIGGFNSRWDEDLSEEEERARFDAALELAGGVLEREIASATSGLKAVRIVREGIANAADPRVIELSENVPWKQVVVTESPEALFVIYPKRQGFGLETVPKELGTFENRQDLPAAWGGLEQAELAELTGVADVLFCHAKLFLVVAESHEGIEALASLAVDQ